MNSNTYWNRKGTYTYTISELKKLIPSEGPVVNPYKNKKLERFRKASNAYYRLYNDGDFDARKAKVFGINSYLYNFRINKYYKDGAGTPKHFSTWSQDLYDEVEVGMDQIIVEAAKEQAIELK